MELGDVRRPIKSHEDLEVFQRSMALVRPAYPLSRKLPKDEEYDLVQQMRRAAKSVPTNIAEGFAKRRTAKDFKLYLAHALGSANEMLVHLRLAEELQYVTKEATHDLTSGYQIVCRQLNKLIQNWR